MAAKDNIGEQFRTIYHFSNSQDPPHLVDHPVFGGPKGLGEGASENRRGSNDVIFGTEEENIDISSARNYKHTYRVPVDSISHEIYDDDDVEKRPVLSGTYPRWQKRPQLWQQLPAKRTDALNQEKVIRFMNKYETVRSVHPGTNEKISQMFSMSYILPKPHFEKLGIQYIGAEPVGNYSSEDSRVVHNRIRDSYGKDVI